MFIFTSLRPQVEPPVSGHMGRGRGRGALIGHHLSLDPTRSPEWACLLASPDAPLCLSIIISTLGASPLA